MNNDILHKEIDLIQGVINRMANNSFLLKGWLISLIAVILVLSNESIFRNDIRFLGVILCFPVIVFWYLDAFFLHKEKCYRELYKWVIENRTKSNDYLYSLDYKRFVKDIKSVYSVMISKTLAVFYGLTFILLALITIIKW